MRFVPLEGSLPGTGRTLVPSRSRPSFERDDLGQLPQTLEAQIDLAVINAMIAGATTNLSRATFTDMSSLWRDLNYAAASLETTSGTLLAATHCFMPPKNFRWLAPQVDSQKRPIWTPDGDSSADPDSGFTGCRIAGTGVYTDGSIPTKGTSSQFIVANPASTLLFRGEPYHVAFPEPLAANLSVVIRLHCYVAPVVRYPSAAATISGGAYLPSPVFA